MMRYAASVLCVGWLAGCAGTAASLRPTVAPTAAVTRPPVRGEEFHVVGRIEGEGDAYDASMLFDRANTHAQQDQCAPAVAEYDQLLREFATSHLVALTQYNRGLCLQRLTRFADAADAMRAAAAGTRDPDIARTAMFRLAVLGEQGQQPPWVIEGTAALLARPQLTLSDRVEALARRAAALLASGEREQAVAAAEQAVTIAPTPEAVAGLGDDTYAAQARFLLGEATCQQGAVVVYRIEAPDAEDAILRRVTLVTHAHVQFNDAIRIGNPHWAAAAGFRIGEMYRDLYDAIVNAPAPEDWDEHARGIYRRRTSERLRPLLQGALRAWEATLTMAQRTGISDNAWVRRANEALDNLRRLILGEDPSAPTPPRRVPPAPQAVPSTVRPAA